MDRLNIKSRLESVVKDVLDLEDVKLQDSTVADDIEGWDSLAHVRIVVAVEEDLAIRFTTNEAMSVKTVGGFIDLIQSKLSKV